VNPRKGGLFYNTIVRGVKEKPTMAKWPADHMTCKERNPYERVIVNPLGMFGFTLL